MDNIIEDINNNPMVEDAQICMIIPFLKHKFVINMQLLIDMQTNKSQKLNIQLHCAIK